MTTPMPSTSTAHPQTHATQTGPQTSLSARGPLRAWMLQLSASGQAARDQHSRHAMHSRLSWGLSWAGDGRSAQGEAPLVHAGPDGRLLWHLGEEGTLLIQAPESFAYDPERILERFDRWGRVLGERVIDPEAMLRGVQGQVLTLQTTVSAQVRHRAPDHGQARRAVTQRGVEEGQLGEWLARQGAQHGFELLELHQARFTMHMDRRAGQVLPLPVQDLAGVIRVEDPARLAGALRSGIGRGRSFGCGMLRLSPA